MKLLNKQYICLRLNILIFTMATVAARLQLSSESAADDPPNRQKPKVFDISDPTSSSTGIRLHELLVLNKTSSSTVI